MAAAHTHMALKKPQLVVQFAGQQTATSTPVNGGAWLQLSPDTMHQHRLHSQQLMLVGLCHPPEPQPATTPSYSTTPNRPANRSPGALLLSPGAVTPSHFAPSPVQLQPDQVQLVDLWLRAGLTAPPQQQQQQQLPGRFVLPVSLWPCAKLPRGVALVSSGVWSSLVQPQQGDFLALYPVTSGGSATSTGQAAAAQLTVHLCQDPQQQHLLTPQHIQPYAGKTQLPPEAAAGGGFTTPTRKGSGPTPNQGSASSSSKKSKSSSSKGAKHQQQQQGSGGEGADAGASSSSGTLNAAAQWQLQLLQEGVDWSRPRQRQLMQQLVHRQLMGRPFVPGNVVYLPLLGVQVLCLLQPSASSIDQPQQSSQPVQQQPQQQQQDSQQSSQLTPLLVASTTSVQLVPPGEQQRPGGLPSLQAALGMQAAGQQPQTTGTGSGGTQAAAATTLQQRIAAAREAAASAVDGSAQDAAMEAAERAVRAGAAAVSGGGGYGRLGGIQQYSQAIRELVMLPLQLPQLFARFKLRPPRGVLLHGPPGSGKTALARAAALESGASLLVVNGPDVLTEFYGESEAGLSGIFAAAAALSPSIVFIDEIDAIAPSRDAAGHGGASGHTAAAGGGGSAAGEAAARVLTQLLVLMDGLGSTSGGSSVTAAAAGAGGSSGSNASSGQQQSGVQAATAARVVVIAATNRPSAVDPALRRPGRFEREIEVGVPDPAAREDIITVRLSSVKHCLTAAQIHQLAQHTQGFVGADLAALVNEAALAALRRHVGALQHQQHQQQQQKQEHDGKGGAGLCVCWSDFEAARLLVRPSALREVAVEVPQVSWNDVGGLADVKQRLQEAVLWPQTHADALARLGATAPKGVLLYGPPGCSKTLLARAVAATSGLNFLSVKGGELYSSYVGESERAVAALFARARAAAPAIVFFDELDGLVSSRGDSGAGAGVGERVLAQLLTEMDGLQARLGVVVLAATNRPDKVDPALLRPGRFDRLLLVPPPDAVARQEILRVHTRKTPLGSNVDLQSLGARTEGYTGADISAVCREAALAALEEDLQAATVSARHFDAALARVKPSSAVGSALMAQYEQFQRHSGAQAWQPEGEAKFVW